MLQHNPTNIVPHPMSIVPRVWGTIANLKKKFTNIKYELRGCILFKYWSSLMLPRLSIVHKRVPIIIEEKANWKICVHFAPVSPTHRLNNSKFKDSDIEIYCTNISVIACQQVKCVWYRNKSYLRNTSLLLYSLKIMQSYIGHLIVDLLKSINFVQ